MADIMDQKRCPGDFILDIANLGLGVTTSLSRFGFGYRVKNIANSVSLSASLLIEVGREVNKHETLFKDNFQAKFQGAVAKCKEEYEQLAAAIEKVQCRTNDGTEDLPKRAHKRLAWGLDLGDGKFSHFEDELDESYKLAAMAQVIVQLVILQVKARQTRGLSPYDELLLRRVKRSMGGLLELLHETGVGNVMMFSLREPTKPANTTQVARAEKSAEKNKDDDDAGSIASLTLRNPTEVSIPAPVKKGPGAGAGPGPPAPPTPVFAPYRAPDIYEMHRASIGSREKKSRQTVVRLLGIPLSVQRTESELVCAFDRVPMSQADIRAFLDRNQDRIATRPAIEELVEVPAATSSAVYTYLATRNSQPHTWTVECVLACPAEAPQPRPRRLWRPKKDEKRATTGHIVVFRGEAGIRHCWGGPPGGGGGGVGVCPPPGFRGPPIPLVRRPTSSRSSSSSSSSSSSTASRKRSGGVARFELSQQETEDVINDYLASFTTLHDGVPVEQWGAALKAIELPTGDESDHGSGSSSSSRSLVDD